MTQLLAYWRTHRKAVLGAIASLASFLVAHNVFPASSDWSALISAVAAFVTVHVTPNAPTAPKPEGA